MSEYKLYMAKLLWGKVYYHNQFAGRLQEDAGGRVIFTYDAHYLAENSPAIAHTLPLQEAPHIHEQGLPPFFDNLVAEGWLQQAQARALAVDSRHRFALLLGFGFDLAGAVSVIDPEREAPRHLENLDEVTRAALSSRASLSGIQRKLLVVKEGRSYRPSGPHELSTHIAKLPSGNLDSLLELEYLSTLAAQKLLSMEEVVSVEIAEIPVIHERALVIPRFDRDLSGNGVQRLHFEEFNQLLGHSSGDDKYDGAYEDMARFIQQTPGCIPAEAESLFRRVLVCLLMGNTDAHLKNFAMFHLPHGLRLTPAYDMVASFIYPEFSTIALSVGGAKNLDIRTLKPKHLALLGHGFHFSDDVIQMAVSEIERKLPRAMEAVSESEVGHRRLREQLCQLMEKRWNGSFNLIGRFLSKRHGGGAKRGA